MEYREKRRLIFAISLLILSILYFFSRYTAVFLVFGSMLSLILFYLADNLMKWEFELKHYIIFIIIVVAGFIFMPFYFANSSVDKYQHFFFPLMTCFLIYHILDKTNLSKRQKIGFTLTILITTITIFEIFEYLADIFWNAKLQGVYSGSWMEQKFELIMPRIDDTMVDIMLGIAGGITFIAGKLIFKKRK
jgi:hypothetical protein